MASGKVLSFIVNAIDKVTEPFRKIGSAVAQGCRRIFSNLANIKAGFDMLAAAVRKAGEWMQNAFAFDDLHQEWSQLLGDMEKARKHAEMLWELGETPPFSAQAFSAASRILQNWGGEVINTRANLVLVGDAAAATGNTVEAVAEAMGRSFAMLRDGADVSRVVMQLQNMKLVTPAVGKQMKALAAEGASSAEIWAMVTQGLGKYNGAMDAAGKSANGMVATLKGKVSTVLKDVGQKFLDLAKGEIGYLIDRIEAIRKSGAIAEWAEKARRAIEPLVKIVGNLFDGSTRQVTLDAAWEKLKSVLVWAWDALKATLEYGANLFYAKIQSLNPLSSNSQIEGLADAYREQYEAKMGLASMNFRYANEKANKAIEEAAEKRRATEAEAAKKSAEEQAEEAKRREEDAESERRATEALEQAQKEREEAEREHAGAVKEAADKLKVLEAEFDALKDTVSQAERTFDALSEKESEAIAEMEARNADAGNVRAGRNADGSAMTGRGLEAAARQRKAEADQKRADDAQAGRMQKMLDASIQRNGGLLGLGKKLDSGVTSDLLGKDWEKNFKGTAAEREAFRQLVDANDKAKAAQDEATALAQRRQEADEARLAAEEAMKKKGIEMDNAKNELDALNKQTGYLDKIEKNTQGLHFS